MLCRWYTSLRQMSQRRVGHRDPGTPPPSAPGSRKSNQPELIVPRRYRRRVAERQREKLACKRSQPLEVKSGNRISSGRPCTHLSANDTRTVPGHCISWGYQSGEAAPVLMLGLREWAFLCPRFEEESI